jgi:hypothetical protein
MGQMSYLACLIWVLLGSDQLKAGSRVSNEPQVQCNDSSLEIFKKDLEARNIKRLVFFASWCLSCKKHILESNVDSTLFIVAYDNKERALSALNGLFSPERRTRVQCQLDSSEDIIGYFNVKSLPHYIILNSN